MAEKQNPGYIEQLREMRALRTQQLRGMNTDQRFYANMNANQRALVQANQKLAASFDSMSKTFTSSIRGLTSAVGGLASKGASAAGSVAGGVGSIAGSITSGLGKVLPFALAGLVGKMLIWDNLTGDNKERLTSSVSKLFSNIFGNLPDMFRGVIQNIIKSVSSMDIKLPIVGTLMDKAEAFFKLFGASIELIKLKFEDMMEFFEGIKDPAKLFESGLKALSAGTLAKLLLPATVSLLTSIIGNRILMGMFGNVLDSRLGGHMGGGFGGGGGGNRVSRKRAMAASVAGSSVVAGGVAKAVSRGLIKGVQTGAKALLLAIPVFGELLLMGYTAYELYQIAIELGFSPEDANELSTEPEIKTDSVSYFGETRPTDKGREVYKEARTQNESNRSQLKNLGISNADKNTRKMLEEDIAKNQKIIDQYDKRIKQFDMEDKAFNKEGVLDSGLTTKFFQVWDFLKGDEKQFAIDKNIPILESEHFVYFYGKNGQIVQRRKQEYLDEISKLPVIEQMSREEFQRKLGGVIKPGESGEKGYNAVYGNGKVHGSILPPKSLTSMTGEEVLAYQKELRNATQGKLPGQPADVGSSAVGAYQIIRSNLTNEKKEGYYDRNPDELSKPFDAEQQDKIYRFLLKGAVDDFMNHQDKQKFKDAVYGIWEVFKQDTPAGDKARKELDALLNNEVFSDTSSDSTKKQSKEQRAAREKISMQIIDDSLKKIMMPGDTTLATVKGVDVVDEGVKKVKEAATAAKGWLDSIIPSEDINTRAERFFNSTPAANTAKEIQGSANTTPNITVLSQDNSVKVGSASSGGGGSSTPTMSFNNFISRPYEQNYRFNSLAGGNPLA